MPNIFTSSISLPPSWNSNEEMEGEFLAIMLVLIAEQLAEYPDADRRYQVSDEFFETEFHKAKREIGTGKISLRFPGAALTIANARVAK